MNKGQTKSLLRGLPKVELHRHLDCSMRFSTFLELAPQLGIALPKNIQDAERDFLVLEPMHDLKAVLNKFLFMQRALASEEILERLAFECIEDAALEGIRILELRWSPGFILQGHPNLKPEKILSAFLRGQARAQKQYSIAVGLLGIIQRTKPQLECHQWADFFIDHKDCFVGVDLADDENFAPAKSFADIFAKVRSHGLKVTIHAGEEPSPTSAENVWDAVEILGASRIGHGLQIISNPEICRRLADRKIPLELCPWSNYLTKAINSIDQHPFKRLKDLGLMTTINTDDPGIFNIDLTHEYELLQKYFSLSIEEFEQTNDWAAQYSFISHQEKQRVWPRPIKIT